MFDLLAASFISNAPRCIFNVQPLCLRSEWVAARSRPARI